MHLALRASNRKVDEKREIRRFAQERTLKTGRDPTNNKCNVRYYGNSRMNHTIGNLSKVYIMRNKNKCTVNV